MAAMTRSLSPSQQALFAQEKLRLIHRETCLSLHLHRDFLFLLQDILLWRKMLISAAIVFLVESFFWRLHTSDNTYITVISDVVFWLLLADGFWVVATRDRRVESKGGAGNPARRSFLQNLRRQQKEMHFLSLEEAISRDAKSLEIGESAPFEVMCLWISKVIMLVDNIQLALRHWSQEQPYLFSIVTGTFGLSCVLIGYFMSGVLIMFLLTNYFMFLPVFNYYNLTGRASAFFNTHYPVLAHKVVASYQYIKSLLTPLAEQEFVGIQLDPNKPMKDGLPDTPLSPSSSPDQLDTASEPNEDGMGVSPGNDPGAMPYPLPTQTLRQRPVLKQDRFDIDPMDSLAPFIPPSEGFPSITAFFNEDSISLPSFPESYGQRPPQRGVPRGMDVSNRRGYPEGGDARKNLRPQDSLSLEPFEMMDPMHDSFDDELTSLRQVPSEPPPPYTERHASYSTQYSSPLLDGTSATPTTSTPFTDEGSDPNIGLRHREKK